MKKIVVLLGIVLAGLAGLAAPAQATYLKFFLTFNFSAVSGAAYHVQCLDAITGEVLLSEVDIVPGQRYTLRTPQADHDKILCIVRVVGGPTVGVWRFFPKEYYQGCGGSVTSSLPDDPGTCGDGAVTGAETCDVSGNAGCTPGSAAPRCCRCEYCGCATAADCPQVTAAPCGYGRCGPTERPVFSVTCYDCGVCLYPYRCVPDPLCAGGGNPVETPEAALCVDTDTARGALAAGQAGTWVVGGEPVQVANDGATLLVNGVAVPGSPEPGSAFALADGSLAGILDATPPDIAFWLAGEPAAWAEAEDWLAGTAADEAPAVGNRACLAGFLADVVGRLRDRRPLELANLVVAGDAVYRARARRGKVRSLRWGFFPAPTLRVVTDVATVEAVLDEEITVRQAIRDGRIVVRRP